MSAEPIPQHRNVLGCMTRIFLCSEASVEHSLANRHKAPYFLRSLNIPHPFTALCNRHGNAALLPAILFICNRLNKR
jgi:hypothetical protein